jgi:hypothetical protein
MSDRRRFWLLVGLAASGWTGTAAAQDLRVLERRIDRLAELRRDAIAARARADSARREILDTVRAGALLVLARPSDAPRVRPAAGRAWRSLDSLFGTATRHLAGQPLLFWVMTLSSRDLVSQSQPYQRVMVPETATLDDIAQQLIRAGALEVHARTDTAMASWLGSALQPVVHQDIESSRVYVELVTAPSVAVRRCFSGENDGCRQALGLLHGEEPAVVWYDADERRALVRRMADIRGLSLRGPRDACLNGDSDADCLALLRANPWLETPLSRDARHSFARLALAAGGPEAHDRLMSSVGRPTHQRFAVAAGMPADSLLERWRAAVLAARPKPVTMTASGGWVALGWALGFGLLALRSTRWR